MFITFWDHVKNGHRKFDQDDNSSMGWQMEKEGVAIHKVCTIFTRPNLLHLIFYIFQMSEVTHIHVKSWGDNSHKIVGVTILRRISILSSTPLNEHDDVT